MFETKKGDGAKEFFERVEKSLKECKGSDPVGVGWFMLDMEELFEEWEGSEE